MASLVDKHSKLLTFLLLFAVAGSLALAVALTASAEVPSFDESKAVGAGQTSSESGIIVQSGHSAASAGVQSRPPDVPCTYNGSITDSDPGMSPRWTASTTPPCAAGIGCASTGSDFYHYDTYTLFNSNPSGVCVTITLSGTAWTAGQIQSAAFQSSFDPTTICDPNFLGKGGSPYSVTVPAGTSLIVVVNELDENTGTPRNYTVTIDGLPSCPPDATSTPTPSSTFAATPTNTPTGTSTSAPTNTSTNTVTRTRTPASPTVTSTPCTQPFTDVNPTDYFYEPVLYMYCHGIISGYADGTFRPFNTTTRGQLTKIVVLGFNITLSQNNSPTFQDVPTSDTFYVFIETAAENDLVSGYACGGPGEPCVPPLNRPYFRPYNLITRGQLAKIVVIAADWDLRNPPSPTFADVQASTAFYEYIETAYCHEIISGYACGGPGEPCDNQNRPYFRQFGPATRGQIAKIVYLAILGEAVCPP